MDVWGLYHRYQLGDVLLACILYIITIVIGVSCKPHCRAFQWDDARIANSPHEDTFPNYSLAIMIFATPIAYVVCELFVVKPVRQWTAKCRRSPVGDEEVGAADAFSAVVNGGAGLPSYGGNGTSATVIAVNASPMPQTGDSASAWLIAYAWVRTHMFAVALQAIVIDVLKLYCGRLRPDYLSRLEAAGYTASRKGIPDPMKDPRFYCDLMDEYPALKEGRLSFPSGHSGISFSVFVVVALYAFAHLRPFAFQGSFCRLCLSMLPLTVPLFCAASRTRDNKHHFSDIIGGSVLGIAAALIAFHCCFRSTGGPVAAVRARVEKDIEYMRWRGAVPQRASAHELQTLTSGGATATPTPSDVPAGVTEAELNADPATVSWV